jgi:hypothetical protein
MPEFPTFIQARSLLLTEELNRRRPLSPPSPPPQARPPLATSLLLVLIRASAPGPTPPAAMGVLVAPTTTSVAATVVVAVAVAAARGVVTTPTTVVAHRSRSSSPTGCLSFRLGVFPGAVFGVRPGPASPAPACLLAHSNKHTLSTRSRLLPLLHRLGTPPGSCSLSTLRLVSSPLAANGFWTQVPPPT